jgi:hypothetical protein
MHSFTNPLVALTEFVSVICLRAELWLWFENFKIAQKKILACLLALAVEATSFSARAIRRYFCGALRRIIFS